jgi:hypothetical protein
MGHFFQSILGGKYARKGMYQEEGKRYFKLIKGQAPGLGVQVLERPIGHTTYCCPLKKSISF